MSTYRGSHRVSTTDWQGAWSPEHPIQVRFTDESPKYLSVEAAVARLAAGYPEDETRTREILVTEGHRMIGSSGAIYVLLTMPPLPDCGHPEGIGCGCLDGLDSGPYDSRKYAESGGAAGIS